MATLLGQPSFAHLKAADATLAATPEAAVAFLHQLAEVRGDKLQAAPYEFFMVPLRQRKALLDAWQASSSAPLRHLRRSAVQIQVLVTLVPLEAVL
jgi:hypothetical protein